jgi:site-specific DNA-methyltransferase (adenine-specific)
VGGWEVGGMEASRMSEITLHLGDCLDVMRGMADKSVDAVITDPPYNIGKADWDKIDDYTEWCGSWLLECQRLLKDNGSLYFFHNDVEQIVDLMTWIRENTSFVFKQFIVWNKRFEGASNKGFLDGFVVPDGLRNYQQMAEYCLFYTFQDETGLSMIHADRNCFYSIKKYLDDELDKSGYSEQTIKRVLNNDMNSHYFGFSKRDKSQFALPTKEQYSKLQTTGCFRREYEDLRREYEGLRYTFNNQKTHHSVWNYEIAPRCGHITPKPVELIENIIRHSTNEGDAILDCFAGSGTTGIAAMNTGRNAILIEKEPKYFEIAKRRIAEAQLCLTS